MASHVRKEQLARSEAEGWDPTIVKAPSAPGDKGNKRGHGHRRRRHHHHRGRRTGLIILGIILALLIAAGVATALYINNLSKAMDLGEEKENVAAALTPLDASVAKGEPFYVLLVGSDTREEYGDIEATEDVGGFSDVITVARVNVYDGSVNLLSIPRDTPVDDGEGGYMKINAAHARGGASDSINTIEDFTKLPLSHYVEIHDSGLEKLVDAVGGITVNIPVEINRSTLRGEQIHLEPGTQHINGAEAMAFARERFAYATEGDKHRQEAARQVIQGVLNQIKNTPPLELPGVVEAAAQCVSTDLSLGDIWDIISKLGLGFSMKQGTGPSEGDYDPYLDNTWYCYLNPDGWARVLDTFTSGGDPSDVSYANDTKIFPGAPDDPNGKAVAPAEQPATEQPTAEQTAAGEPVAATEEYVENFVPVYE